MVSQSNSVFIFGYSGHSYVVIESLLDAGYEILGYFDFIESKNNPYGLTYFGNENKKNLKTLIKKNLVFPTIGDNQIRKKLIYLFEKLDLNQFVAIDPSANVSSSAILEKSAYIGKNALVNAQTRVGKGVIINTSAVVEHECKIDNFVHIAPSSVLCGNVYIGENSFIGANTVVKNNINICTDVTIGAGSVVVKSIIEKGIWVGNPLRKIV